MLTFFAVAVVAVSTLSSFNFLKGHSPNKKASAASWYSFDWPKRTSVTIDNTKVTADLTDFPVLINSTNVNWKTIANGGSVAQADGGDFVFTLSDNTTKLSHEIEKYNPATGELIAWVKVPALANLTDTVVNLYFGNALAENQWNATGVWSSNAFVYHLNQASGTLTDSTGAYGMTTNNLPSVAGKIGSAVGYTKTSNQRSALTWASNAVIPAGVQNATSDSMTFSAWINASNTGAIERLFESDSSWATGIDMYKTADNKLMVNIRGNWEVCNNRGNVTRSVTTTTATYGDGQWHYVVGMMDRTIGTNGGVRLYVDGQVVGTSAEFSTAWEGFRWTDTLNTPGISIGGYNDGTTTYYTGNTDEFRYTKNAASSAERVATEYNNQNSPTTFYTLGAIEDGDTTAPTGPTTISGYDTSAKESTLLDTRWAPYANPYFEWSGAIDNESGVKGYWVYLGTDNTADPVNEGTFQAVADTNYVAPSMTIGQTYYLRLVTQNNASSNNFSATETMFTYKYDPTAPSAPEYVNVSPVGCSTQTSFTFTWPAGIDTGGSQMAGYDYKRGSTGTVQQVTELTTPASSYQEGDNVMYVRSRDIAGNVSAWQTAIYCSTASVQVADGPTVETGPSSMTVSWTSNKNTTSYVRVYEGNDYVSEQGQTSYALTHSVKVVGLEPEKSYRYKVVWTDQSGNIGESDWYTTSTSTAPQINDLKVDLLGPTQANVSWKDSISALNTIQYGESAYSTTIDTSGMATTGSYKLENLVSGKIYQLRINATSEDGTKFFAGTSFVMPPLPEISSVSQEPVTTGSSIGAKVSWKTNVETTSSLFYGQDASMKEIATTEKKQDHIVEISGLSDSSSYQFYVAGTDAYGNTAKSSTLSFSTPADRRPPTISDVITETSNVGLNKQDKAQIIISWKTDEPATSYVEYDLGLSGIEYKQKTAEDKNMTNSHLVIISDLQPAQPYHLRVVSLDKGSNSATSEDIAIIAGDVPKSIFNIITDTFENVFGWLGQLI